ncbi:helix-turn-helix domain-containing protein [Alistipes finegoldii]|uniref:helix-turn-helix domain-containing protein n=1 Tax=Alistipes finegoldii TaxID=214856 RepID=UPI0024B17EBA|nr:cupin domain-containing protein [Alistipes finegoldii]
MCDPIKSIANRLRGLREVLELSAQEVAESCHLRVEEYMALESGESDISVNVLQTIARRYGISLDVLMFGEEPKMNAYFITRAGAGVSVERRKAYKYEALASGFRDRKADPFIVTVEPAPADAPMHLNSHVGQEMNYVLEGRLLLSLNGKELVLNVGDSLYFDSSLPHGMKALDGRPVRFLAIIM